MQDLWVGEKPQAFDSNSWMKLGPRAGEDGLGFGLETGALQVSLFFCP